MIRHSANLFFFLLLTLQLGAQNFSMQRWHRDGLLVTSSQDTLLGTLKYDIPSNSVQIFSPTDLQKRILTFNSKKVMYFEFFDKKLDHMRNFYSIPFQIRANYKAPILFEILYEGELTLLAREKIVVEIESYDSFSPYRTTQTNEYLVYDFFFIDEEGKINSYEGKKNDFYSVLTSHQDQVKRYVKKNKLKLGDLKDMIRVVAFYNSL